ncbi:hypothetical protein GXW82_28775 [Streptacidiphilus sp. 4-A2]|nr:hypothetical protein [Streptacidiphilus sp. 4-A2]
MYEQPNAAVRAQRRAAARSVHNGTTHNSSTHGTDEPPSRSAASHAAHLTGHLAALLTATEAALTLTDDQAQRAELGTALEELRQRLAELAPHGAALSQTSGTPARTAAMAHEHAHALAGRLLVVAAAQQDTTTAMLACRRMDAHAAARSAP